jgi:hypothetical protein
VAGKVGIRRGLARQDQEGADQSANRSGLVRKFKGVGWLARLEPEEVLPAYYLLWTIRHLEGA